MKTEQSCGKCDYWDRVGESTSGQCRRYPPSGLVTFDITQEPALDTESGLVFHRPRIVNSVKFLFPQMAEDNFGCGEFKDKDESEKESC